MSTIKTARQRANMTLEELAEEMGSSKSYMWQLENKADPQPGVQFAHKLAHVLGTTIEELFNLETYNDDTDGNAEDLVRGSEDDERSLDTS